MSKSWEQPLIKIILGGAVIAVAVLPFVISEVTFFPGNFARAILFRIIVELILVAYLGLIFINKKYLPPLNPLTILVSGWWLVLFLATLVAPQPLFSFWGGVERMEGLFTMSHYFLFFFILAGTLKEKRQWFLLLNAAVAASAVISAIALLQRLEVAFTQPFLVGNVLPRATATLDSPLFLSSYLLFTIFITLTLLALNPKKTPLLLYGSALLLQILAIFATETRAGQIAFLVGILWFILLLPSKHRLVIKGKVVVGGLMLISALIASLLAATNNLAQTLENLPFVPRLLVYATDWKLFVSSLDQRLDLWKIAWEGIKTRPLLGYGPESFSLVMDRFFPPRLNEFFGQQWLSEPLNVLSNMFLAGGILLLLFYLLIFGALAKGLVFTKKRDLLTHGLFTVFLVYFIQNLVGIDHALTYIPFFVLLAFAGSFMKRPSIRFINISLPASLFHDSPRGKQGELVGLGIGLIIALGMVFFLNVQPLLANRAMQQTIRIAQEAKQLRDATNYFNDHQKGMVRSANVIAYDNSLAQLLVMLDQITALSAPEHPEETKKILENAVALTEKERRFKPKFSKPYLLLARLNTKLSVFDPEAKFKASENYMKAGDLSPNRYIIWVEWAKSDPLLGTPERAVEHGERALALVETPEAHFWTGIGYIYQRLIDRAQPHLAYLKTPTAYQYLERTYKRTQNYEFLITTFYPERIREDPKNLQWRASLAVTYYELGNTKKACETVRELLREPDINAESRAGAEEFLKQLNCK